MPVYDLGTRDLLVRFKHWLQREGEAVGSSDEDTAEEFLKADRNAMIEAAADEAPDPRLT